MSKHFSRLVRLGALLAALVPGTALSGGPFSPQWAVGDRWVVKAEYPLPYDQDRWSKPVLWAYEVEGLEKGPSGDCFVISVRGIAETGREPLLRLVYRAGDHRLVRAESTKIRHGEKSLRVLTYSGERPVATEQSPAPFDSPVFPIQVPSFLTFSLTKEIAGGLKRTETLSQEARKVSGIKESLDLPAKYAEGELIEVRCEDVRGREVFTQYWDESLPFPVYGQNANMKYWLMEP